MVKNYPSNQDSLVNPAEFEDLSGSPVVEYPDAEEQARLIASSEARAERYEKRLGARVVDFSRRPMRGKTRPEFEGGDRLPFGFDDVIPEETVISLGRAIQSQQPLFDQFTDHHRIEPTKEGIEAYVTSANRKRVKKPHPSMPADERKKVMDSMRRQTLNIADKLVQSTFTDRNIARLRRHSLKTIQHQVVNGLPFDEQAAANAADAIQDFGNVLTANREILISLGDEDLGVKIAHIGWKAPEDPEILRQNPLLLRLVQIEQKAREDLQRPLFEAAQKHTRGRLIKRDKQNHRDLETEILRLESVRETDVH